MSRLQSSVGYCKCGQEFWVHYSWDGSGWTYRFLASLDGREEEVERCPVCQRLLKEDELEGCC